MLHEDVLRAHIDRIRTPVPPLELVRPCTLGDGIAQAEIAPAPREAPLRFVPASGAATRMFEAFSLAQAEDLESLRRQAQEEPKLEPAVRAFDGWSDLALSRSLHGVDPRADLPATLQRIQTEGYAARPKGLVPFHIVGDEVRSAIEEHLVEAARAGDGAQAHFTAPGDHLQAFREQVDAAVARVQRHTGVRVQVGLSLQHPHTDTPALDEDGELIRHPDGRPWLRPGGHGALLDNLDQFSGLVRIINVDNVAHPDHREAWRGFGHHVVWHALWLRHKRDHWTQEVRAGRGIEAARVFLDQLGYGGPTEASAVLRDLDRPVRACAVVPNDGQPGGGPFWVRTPDGRIRPQIVEGVEVHHADPEQAAIWASSTHFNPVDLVCWLDDADGEPFDLGRFVDDTRWIRTRKRHGGRPARCLERPGLWNGSMSGWLTQFVAAPRESFNPVKTLADLLGPRHQPISLGL